MNVAGLIFWPFGIVAESGNQRKLFQFRFEEPTICNFSFRDKKLNISIELSIQMDFRQTHNSKYIFPEKYRLLIKFWCVLLERSGNKTSRLSPSNIRNALHYRRGNPTPSLSHLKP